MTEKRFNPAFYISFSSDGEKYLDLAAKMLWFKHEYPGYRIVSDGMDVFTHESVDDDGERVPKTILLGHVAVLNREGVRILSVPCSVSVNASGGDCALEFFEVGADLALDSLGLTPYNITSDQWAEYWRVKKGWEEKQRESERPFGIKSLFAGKEPERAVSSAPAEPQEKTPNFIGQMSAVDAMNEVEEGDESGEEQNVLRIFRDVLVYFPNEVPSYRPGTPVDAEMLEKLFDRFCLSLTGAQWDVADTVERGQIMEKMESLLSEKN